MHPKPIIIIMPSLLLLLLLLLLQSPPSTLSEGPESQLVLLYCGTHHYHNATRAVTSFAANMESISTKVHSTGFAVSSTGSGPDSSHCLAQCYDYLSPVDCILCFSKLRTLGPLCFPSINGRIFLDGCFDRVDNYAFFGEALGPDDRAWCGNRTRWGPSFEKAVTRAVADAVHEAEIGAGHGRGAVEGGGGDGGSRGGSAYAWASCWRTVDPGRCSRCLRNASASATGCLPWSEARVTNTGCFLRYSDTDFMRNNATNGGHPSKGHTHLKVGAIISSVVIMGLCLAIVLFFVFKCNREIEKKRKVLNKTLKMIESALVKSSLNFKYSTLVAATGSFDPANKLGEGGYGAVYKGVLADGREIAVKRLFFNNRHRAMDFINEVNIISIVEHKNLVRLLGCCCSGPESLLIYEYLPNKSLDQFIFDHEKRKEMNWERRFKIITGTAQGLVYLHENPKVRIIHRDIKASNILLDSKLQAKIADFGLVRSFTEDKSHISTAIVGTLGYMAPEYVAHGQLTEKADVYSFGVLLLEIITGRQNGMITKTSEYSDSLLTLAWKHYQIGTMDDIIDSNMTSNNCTNSMRRQVLRTAQIAFLCTQENALLRPSMSRALQMLMNGDEELPKPTNPPFIDEDMMELNLCLVNSNGLLCNSSSSSVATMSYSSFCPR